MHGIYLCSTTKHEFGIIERMSLIMAHNGKFLLRGKQGGEKIHNNKTKLCKYLAVIASKGALMIGKMDVK